MTDTPRSAETPKKKSRVTENGRVLDADDPRIQPDWRGSCMACGASPILPLTDLCGPCTFGDAETSGGNWLDD